MYEILQTTLEVNCHSQKYPCTFLKSSLKCSKCGLVCTRVILTHTRLRVTVLDFGRHRSKSVHSSLDSQAILPLKYLDSNSF